MLSNAYFLANFRFDTAENEPAKILQIFQKKNAAAALRGLSDRLQVYEEFHLGHGPALVGLAR